MGGWPKVKVMCESQNIEAVPPGAQTYLDILNKYVG